ncbi:MAG: alanyl-tRNA editing protein [Vicinamibacteria bacterium]|nr:alanyl-tRNA editing protein [Vicinamibacteria bacterium]
MTERLYFTDAYLTEFESLVTTCTPAGDRFEVSLDASAFYPTGGGQPHDLGALGERAVLEVIDREEEGIVHVVDGPLEPGTRVKGVIDWPRRFDHMQQHSGQHMLSAAFESIGQAQTSSFHLGATLCTIDLNRVVSPTDVAAAEDEANRVVWLDREVRVCFAPADEGAALALRKESTRVGTLRLIEVDDFDRSACGGTHVARTGAVGIIAVTGCEKFKGGTRVEFVCGRRALGRIREWREVFSLTSRVLSVVPKDLALAIERLQADNKSLSRTARELQSQLAVHKAAELVSAGVRADDERIVVVHAFEGWDASGLNAVASAAAASSGVCAAVFSASTPALVVVARASDVGLNASAVVKALIARFGGKGGGKPELAQGGGLQGDIAEMVAAARHLLATLGV